jgi:hypothetical protein
MSKKLIDGIWVVECDWVDATGKPCSLGLEGAPAMFVDPNRGKNATDHFQCGRHHGIIPQSERPEFQLPDGHRLNESVLRAGETRTSVEEVGDE